jgi:hypothetical protein
MRPGGNRPIAVIKKVRHFAGMPTHPHLLVVTLIGLLLILRGFRTERVSWVGSSFDRSNPSENILAHDIIWQRAHSSWDLWRVARITRRLLNPAAGRVSPTPKTANSTSDGSSTWETMWEWKNRFEI